MKRFIISFSSMLATILLISVFTAMKPFEGTNLSLIGGLSIFTLT
ncbi:MULTISPECIES: peptide ABC transporter permease [Listeria]|nr:MULTISPECIES: peptide ABC transporter permease [Listeria]MBC1516939.1 peptide ABC transporter permease [Listeria immobilis]MBF2600183.1 peptide ABC transporter permease [Listeria seeligeri]